MAIKMEREGERIWLAGNQNVSILDFIGAKDDWGGGDHWSCTMICLEI